MPSCDSTSFHSLEHIDTQGEERELRRRQYEDGRLSKQEGPIWISHLCVNGQTQCMAD